MEFLHQYFGYTRYELCEVSWYQIKSLFLDKDHENDRINDFSNISHINLIVTAIIFHISLSKFANLFSRIANIDLINVAASLRELWKP